MPIYDIFLERVDISDQLDVSKPLRIIFSQGLGVIMEIMDAAPVQIMWNVPEAEALRVKELIIEGGGGVRLEEVHIEEYD